MKRTRALVAVVGLLALAGGAGNGFVVTATAAGAPQQGNTLTADTGTWTGTAPISYAYQWRRCDTAGAACTDVAGATGATYVLAAADVGATIRVAVTATNVAGASTAVSDQTAVVTALAPVNSTVPIVSGTTTEGSVLTTDNGTWQNTPTAYTYQWQRCTSAGTGCTAIAGATAATYTLQPADIGSTLRSVVTATNSGGTASATSAATAVVAGRPPVNTGPPTIGVTSALQADLFRITSWH